MWGMLGVNNMRCSSLPKRKRMLLILLNKALTSLLSQMRLLKFISDPNHYSVTIIQCITR